MQTRLYINLAPYNTPNHAHLFDQNEILHSHNHLPTPYKQPAYICITSLHVQPDDGQVFMYNLTMANIQGQNMYLYLT